MFSRSDVSSIVASTFMIHNGAIGYHNAAVLPLLHEDGDVCDAAVRMAGEEEGRRRMQRRREATMSHCHCHCHGGLRASAG